MQGLKSFCKSCTTFQRLKLVFFCFRRACMKNKMLKVKLKQIFTYSFIQGWALKISLRLWLWRSTVLNRKYEYSAYTETLAKNGGRRDTWSEMQRPVRQAPLGLPSIGVREEAAGNFRPVCSSRYSAYRLRGFSADTGVYARLRPARETVGTKVAARLSRAVMRILSNAVVLQRRWRPRW